MRHREERQQIGNPTPFKSGRMSDDVAKASASERLHASNNIEEYGKK